ncbi:MAG: galactokinase [Treponema sp.]|nr:galactokinase [Treponema sp.]
MQDIGAIHRKEYDLEADGVGKDGEADRIVIARAPGRLHLLGEHCLSPGLFLSAAIDRWAQVAISPRKDGSLRFYAPNLSERKRTTMASLKYKREDRWANYAKVAIHLFSELGVSLKGLNFTVIGDIPQSVGLASSTAIEIATAMALREMLGFEFDDRALAVALASTHRLYFEQEPCLADYLAGLCWGDEEFLVIDEANLSITGIKSPLAGYRLVLTDSRVPRLGTEAEIETRKLDIAAAVQKLSHRREGASLREFVAEDLMDSMGNLPEKIRRRSLYAVQDIQRVHDAGELLRRADLPSFAKLIFHSHEGLRDLYEISCPEIDWMVKRAQETPGVCGARMAGEGFGGCTYALVKGDAVDEYRNRLDDYERIFGFHPLIHEVGLASGNRILSGPSSCE